MTHEPGIDAAVAEVLADPVVEARIQALIRELEADPAVGLLDELDRAAAIEQRGRFLGWQIMQERGLDPARDEGLG